MTNEQRKVIKDVITDVMDYMKEHDDGNEAVLYQFTLTLTPTEMKAFEALLREINHKSVVEAMPCQNRKRRGYGCPKKCPLYKHLGVDVYCHQLAMGTAKDEEYEIAYRALFGGGENK